MKKKKASYPFLSNMKYLFAGIWHVQKRATVIILLRAPLLVVISFLGIYLSKEVVAAVSAEKTVEELLWTIAIISGGILFCSVCEKIFYAIMYKLLMAADLHWQMILFEKTVSMDYENLENPDGLTKLSKAMGNCGSEDSVTRIAAEVFSSLFSNVIGIITYSATLSVLSPWITLVVTVSTLSGFFLLKQIGKWSYKNRDQWAVYDRKLTYLKVNSGDFQRAKDIRLYKMTHWFMNVFADTLKKRIVWYKKEQAFGFKVDLGMAALNFLREGFAYGFLVFLIFNQGMSVSDFVLYFGLIGGFATWLLGFVRNIEALNRSHLGVCEIREFLDIPDHQNHRKGIPLPSETFSIEFKNVSFRYPKNNTDTIQNLSFKIEKGEKIAIVGLNGAGKTTLVKLMCGLYTPTSGVILINGAPVSSYNIIDYYSLFSVVFQEIFMLPMSIARNVSASKEENTDKDKVMKAIQLAGLAEKINSLPKGIETNLVKSVYDDAIDLSGGELQKLALARALYKGGKALILDEPTAALDPIAESRIYREYDHMSQGHTSVFISHRLASTRFCDKIFLLENGRIVESGTHQELLDFGGKYSELFEIQSRYYREDVSASEMDG